MEKREEISKPLGNALSWLVVFALVVVSALVLGGFLVLRSSRLFHYPYDRLIASGYVVIVLAIAAAVRFWGGRALLWGAGVAIACAIAIPCVLTDAWKPFLASCWIFGVSAGIGRRLLRIIAPAARFRCLDEWLLSATAGYGACALIVLLAGSAIGVTERSLLGILVVTTLAAARDFASLVGRAQRRIRAIRKQSRPGSDLRLGAAFLALMTLCGLGSWIWSLVPPNDYDGLLYHVGTPAAFLANGNFYMQAERSHSVLAKNPSMLYLLGLAVGGAVTPKMLHFSCAILVSGLVYSVGRRLSSARVGLIAALLFFAMPLVTWEGGSTFIDLFATLFVFGSFWSILTWRDRGWDSASRVAGLFAGFAVGTKITTISFIIPELVVLAAISGISLRFAPRTFRQFVQFGAVAFAVVLPWCVRDFLWTGNPVFPLLNSVFKNPLWPIPASFWTMYGNDLTFLNFVLVPLRLHFYPLLYCEDIKFGGFAGMTVLCLPIFVAFMKTETKRLIAAMATYSVLSTAIWFVSIQYTRYLLPAMPVLALMAALNWQAGVERLSAVPRTWYLRTSIAFGVALIVLTRWVGVGTNNDCATRYPFAAALGRMSREDFLFETLREYRALSTLACEVPGRSQKVLSVGTELRFYSKDVPIYEVSGWAHAPAKWRNEILETPAGPELSAALRRHGFGYLLISGAWLDICSRSAVAPVASVVDRGFLNRRCEFVAGRGQDLVYRLLDDAHCGPPALGANLVRGADFQAEFTESARLEGIRSKTDEAKRLALAYGKGTALIDEPVEIEGAFSIAKKTLAARAYPAEGGKRYWLRLKCRCDDSKGEPAAEVQFFDGSRHLHTERRSIRGASGWNEFDMYVEADARATTARIVLSAPRYVPACFGEVFFAEYLGHGGKDPSNSRPALADARRESAQR